MLCVVMDKSRASGNTKALPIMKDLANYLSLQDRYMASVEPPESLIGVGQRKPEIRNF